uniref:Pre-mRNA-splicing factor CWC25 homolog n=1 Tax=Syphacia muris TaxID=451379 RepID=A0A0N5AGX7_9BILA
MSESGNRDTQLNWIYEGTKAAINREDYLLGKRVNKNFELYSDVVNNEKEDNFDLITSGRSRIVENSNTKTSNLEINVVRKEDPLVAIKVKEETLRQEKLENPLFLMRMQRLLKEAMEKKARKQRRKEMKELRKRRKRHSSASPDESVCSGEKEKHSEKVSDNGRNNSIEKSEKKRMFDSHIPEHLRPKNENDSDSSSSDQKSADAEMLKQPCKVYGLIEAKSNKKTTNASKASDSQVTTDQRTNNLKQQVQDFSRKPTKRKLTDEEKEAKLREMTENAKWRDSSRKQALKRANEKEKIEEEKEKRAPADFIKPMLNFSGSTITLEKRLNSTRKNLQKDYGYMERSLSKR